MIYCTEHSKTIFMILGSFYLRQVNNGNLLGEFCNNTMMTSSTESADRIVISQESNFEGVYNSTWFENGAEVYTLNIQALPPPATVFILEWTNASNNVVFRGEGFLMGNILMGNYWDENVHNIIGNGLR